VMGFYRNWRGRHAAGSPESAEQAFQPLGEIPLQICCRCNNENLPLQFRVAAYGSSPCASPGRPRWKIEPVVVGFRMTDYPCDGPG
jgi:hypothetical protein